MTGEQAPAVIRTFGAAVLRRKARKLPVGADETRQLMDRLWRTLRAGTGVGLAAPQIGVAARACVLRDPERDPDGTGDAGRIDLVNPVLKKTFGPPEVFEEGCLSFPGLYFDVVRRRGVVIEYHDADGRPRTLRDEGLVARIAQHEMDHLDGVLFIDRVGGLRRMMLWPRLAWIALVGALTGRSTGS